MTPVHFHPQAELEMLEGAVWYEGEQQGLGKRLLDLVREAIASLTVYPGIHKIVEGDVR
jgi:hypothetical protein